MPLGSTNDNEELLLSERRTPIRVYLSAAYFDLLNHFAGLKPGRTREFLLGKLVEQFDIASNFQPFISTTPSAAFVKIDPPNEVRRYITRLETMGYGSARDIFRAVAEHQIDEQCREKLELLASRSGG